MNATTILNEILQKLSVLTKEDELTQELSDQEVQNEALETVSEATEEVQEEPAELSEESVEAAEDAVVEEEAKLNEGYVSEEQYMADMASLKAEIDSIKQMVEVEMSEVKKEKEMLSEQVKELSKEPAAEPIKHNPEGEEAKKFNFTYGQNKPQSTFDRVMARISNK